MAAEIFGDKDASAEYAAAFSAPEHDGDIDVAEGIAFGLNPPPGFAQQFAAVGAFKGRVGIREQLADIPSAAAPSRASVSACSAVAGMGQQPFS
jgi:hypothetical protein